MKVLFVRPARWPGWPRRARLRLRAAVGAAAAIGLLPLHAATGFVSGWGANDARQIEPPLDLNNALIVAAGAAHAIALREDGSLAAWGDNAFGQASVPAGSTQIVAVAAGQRHNLALRADGALFGWGDNLFGQLNPPAGLTGLVAVAAGGTHSLALRSNGTVVAWGGNSSGQATVPGALGPVQAIAAGAFHSLALRLNGTVAAWGYSGNGQGSVPAGLSNVIAVACGYNHNLALRANGTVVAWGFNGQGQTNVPAGLSNVMAVAAGAAHSLALRRDGTVVAWGGSTAGEAIPPLGLTNLQQVAGGGFFTLARSPGPAVLRQPADVRIVPGATIALEAVAAGTGALTLQWQKDGQDIPGATQSTLTFPDAQYGQFGDYRLRVSDALGTVYSRTARLLSPPVLTNQPRSLHVFYGSAATFEVGATGSGPFAYRWLTNSAGPTLATNSSFTLASANFQQAAGYWAVVSNSVGMATSSVARLFVQTAPSVSLPGWLQTHYLYDGAVYLTVTAAGVAPDGYQWQWNGLDIPGATNAVFQFSAGRPAHSGAYRCIALTAAGRLTGSNLNLTVARADPVQFEGRRMVLEVGDTFGLAQAFRWFHDGAEIPGQTNRTLVIETLAPADSGTYTVTASYAVLPDQPFEVARLTVLPAPAAGSIVSWGYTNQLPGLPLTTLRDAIAVAMGDTHVLALRADGRVFQWRYNNPSSSNVWRALEPVVGLSGKGSGAAVLGADGRATSDTWSYCNPCAALDNDRFVQVAFGGEFAIGLQNDGTAVGWGINGSGQATVPAGLSGLVAVAAGAAHAMALRNDGTVVAWGNNDYGQATVPAGLSNVTAIACGASHSLALRSDGQVFAWGYNSHGQRTVPVGLSGVVGIGAGPEQSFVLRPNGSVYGWGLNDYGQCRPPSGLTGAVFVTGGSYATTALVGTTNNPSILEHPVGAVRDVGDSYTFRTRAWSASPLIYQWRHNGTNIAGATGPSLTLASVQPADEGEYSAAVSTQAAPDPVLSDAALLLVNPAPYLALPPTRGRVVVWGGEQYVGRTPLPPPDLGQVRLLSAGPESIYSFAIGADGSARRWGANSPSTLAGSELVQVVGWNGGQLGLRANGVVGAWDSGGTEIAPPPGLRGVVQLAGNGDNAYVAVLGDGTIRHPFAADFFPVVPTNVVQAAVGAYHAALLLADGTVALSRPGYPSEQTPVPAGLSNVVQVAAGAQHTLALRRDGTVIAWGRNTEGQCDVPTVLGSATAVAAGENFSMALRADGTVAVWGDDTHGQLLVPAGLTNVAAIAAGLAHGLALQRGPTFLSTPSDLNTPPGNLATFQATAQGSGTLRYQWFYYGQPIAGATNDSLLVVAGAATQGPYSVTVFDDEGAISADAMLWLGVPPEILVPPEGRTIAAGSSVTFSVLASGLGPLAYQWQFNGADIIGATGSTYSIVSATTNKGGAYRVRVTNAFGPATSPEAVLTVVLPPTFLSPPAALTRAVGETARFTVVTGGGLPQGFQWLFNGVALPDQTNAALVLPAVRTNDAGTYAVRVSNVALTITSPPAVLTVVPPAPRFVVAPADQVVGFGADARWDVVATGAATLGYQWYFNEAPLPGATGPSLLVTNADPRVAGFYKVTVSNSYDSVTSTPAQLTVRQMPNLVLWGTNDLVRAIPPDLTNAVSVSGSEHVLALRDDGTVTAWGLDDRGQADVPPGLSNVVAVAAGGRHSLALRNDGRLVAWGQDTYGETDLPANLTNVVAIAAGTSHSVALRADGTLAGWGYNTYGQATPPAGLSNIAGVTANSESTLALKSDGTVVEWGVDYFPPPGLSNVVAVMGRARMLALRADGRVVGWGPGGTGGVEGPAGVASADSYWAPVTVSGATLIETHEIGLLTNHTVAIWGTNRGGIFNPPAGLSNVSCVAAGSFFNAAVLSGPVIVRQPRDIAAPTGTPAVLEVQALSRLPLQYQWHFNGTNLPASTNATLSFTALAPSNTGPYSVLVRDAIGPVLSRTAAVRVLSDPPYLSLQPVSQAVNEGSRVLFHLEAEGAAPLAYQWYHNGAALDGATQADLILSSAGAADAGIYAARVSNAHGSVTSSSALLTLGIADVVVDNPAAAVAGPWQMGNNAGQIGTNYLFITQGWGANQVRFTPTLPRAGTYTVFSRYFSQVQPSVSPALHVIQHGQGSSAVLPAAVSGWSLLGTFSFAAGNSGSVAVLDVFPNVAALGVADAVRFVYVPAPPAIAVQPQNADAVEGSELVLWVSVTGATPLHYQWQWNGDNLDGANSDRLTLPSVSRAQAGSYRVLVSNTDGALYSQEAIVRIVAPPLQPAVESGSLVLRWDGTATLQTSTNAAGPYEDLPAAVSGVKIPLEEDQRYFRLKR